ncbi:MAG: DUF5018 domain-containing protein [Candidatus Taylorbacteria bacterium]|nr:DUF5018 domain-containing protein [Candidatus Taylorbacteria bacterium]
MKYINCLRVLLVPVFIYVLSYTIADAQAQIPNQCILLTESLGRGVDDSETNSQVSLLQNFLISNRYLNLQVPTGYFGSKTASAVRAFQSANGVSATGFVGPRTRNLLRNITCGNTVVPPPGTTINPTALRLVTNFSNNENGSSTFSLAIQNPLTSTTRQYAFEVNCPSGISLYYKGQSACGNFSTASDVTQMQISVQNTSESSQTIPIKIIAIGSYFDRLGEYVHNISVSGKQIQQTINVLSPQNTNQVYTRLATTSIYWNSTGTINALKIDLVRTHSSTTESVFNIANNVQNTGEYRWYIPSGVPVGSGYKYKISDANNQSLSSLSTRTFSVEEELSARKNITSFGFNSLYAQGNIDNNTKTITIQVPQGTNLTALTPTITVSQGARISPASGVAQNFTSPKTYTVTAQNGTVQTYTVRVNAAGGSSAKEITDFRFRSLNVVGTIDNLSSPRVISVTVPANTPLTSMTPTITVAQGASVTPASGQPRDFRSPVDYTVTAQNGSSVTYRVFVNKR